MIWPVCSTFDVMSLESKDLFFSLLKILPAKCYPESFGALVMVVSNTVVEEICLNVLWHMSQKQTYSGR